MMNECVDLIERFGKRFRVGFDPAYDPAHRPKDKLDPWYMVTLCLRRRFTRKAGSCWLRKSKDAKGLESGSWDWRSSLRNNGGTISLRSCSTSRTFTKSPGCCKPRRRRQLSDAQCALWRSDARAFAFKPRLPTAENGGPAQPQVRPHHPQAIPTRDCRSVRFAELSQARETQRTVQTAGDSASEPLLRSADFSCSFGPPAPSPASCGQGPHLCGGEPRPLGTGRTGPLVSPGSRPPARAQLPAGKPDRQIALPPCKTTSTPSQTPALTAAVRPNHKTPACGLNGRIKGLDFKSVVSSAAFCVAVRPALAEGAASFFRKGLVEQGRPGIGRERSQPVRQGHFLGRDARLVQPCPAGAV